MTEQSSQKVTEQVRWSHRVQSLTQFKWNLAKFGSHWTVKLELSYWLYKSKSDCVEENSLLEKKKKKFSSEQRLQKTNERKLIERKAAVSAICTHTRDNSKQCFMADSHLSVVSTRKAMPASVAGLYASFSLTWKRRFCERGITHVCNLVKTEKDAEGQRTSSANTRCYW